VDRDTKYVDGLIATGTVITRPGQALQAFARTGKSAGIALGGRPSAPVSSMLATA
jgi:hypothetical protein